MKLYVRWCWTPLGACPALFDEAGNLLPSQTGCSVSARVGEPPSVTVSFMVDGEGVIIDPQVDPNAKR